MQNRKDSVVYAGFFARLGAYLIDSILISMMLLFVKGVALIIKMFAGNPIVFQPIFFKFSMVDILCYFIFAGYFILFTYLSGSTLGKKLFCLEVITFTEKKLSLFTVIYRETIGRYLSGLLCIGYIFIGVDEKKRGFHDILCDTYVIYKGMKKENSKDSVEQFFAETI